MIERVKYIDYLCAIDLPRDQFLLTGSVWLAIMRIRENEDIDIIATNSLRGKFDDYVKRLEEKGFQDVREYVDVSKKHANKITKIAKLTNVDDLVRRHYVEIDGFRFVKFKLFEAYKKPRKRQKDKLDRKAIAKFFKRDRHLLPEYAGLF